VREASQLFSYDLLQDVAVQGQVRHDLFQFVVFVAERPELAQLGEAEPGELLLPAVEGLLADAEPAADLGVTFSPPSTWCRAWMISSLLRPLRGIVCVSLAGVASLLRKSQILRFSRFACTGLWGLGQLEEGGLDQLTRREPIA
jgi:hypothetical protein